MKQNALLIFRSHLAAAFPARIRNFQQKARAKHDQTQSGKVFHGALNRAVHFWKLFFWCRHPRRQNQRPSRSQNICPLFEFNPHIWISFCLPLLPFCFFVLPSVFLFFLFLVPFPATERSIDRAIPRLSNRMASKRARLWWAGGVSRSE